MVRIIGFFVGLGFCLVLAIAFFTGAHNQITNPPAETAEKEFHLHPKPLPNSISESVLHGEEKESAPLGAGGVLPGTQPQPAE